MISPEFAVLELQRSLNWNSFVDLYEPVIRLRTPLLALDDRVPILKDDFLDLLLQLHKLIVEILVQKLRVQALTRLHSLLL